MIIKNTQDIGTLIYYGKFIKAGHIIGEKITSTLLALGQKLSAAVSSIKNMGIDSLTGVPIASPVAANKLNAEPPRPSAPPVAEIVSIDGVPIASAVAANKLKAEISTSSGDPPPSYESVIVAGKTTAPVALPPFPTFQSLL